jgi:hypothetical protein
VQVPARQLGLLALPLLLVQLCLMELMDWMEQKGLTA